MRVDSTLQKLEIYVVAAVAVVLVSFFLSSPFSAEDYGLANRPVSELAEDVTRLRGGPARRVAGTRAA